MIRGAVAVGDSKLGRAAQKVRQAHLADPG
jgi:hypothetical protein